MDNLKIGNFLLRLRLAKNMTQAEEAEALGVTNKSVSKWECGEALPSPELLLRIARLHGVTVDEILEGEFKKKEEGGEKPKDLMKDDARYVTSICLGSISAFISVASVVVMLAFVSTISLGSSLLIGLIATFIAGLVFVIAKACLKLSGWVFAVSLFCLLLSLTSLVWLLGCACFAAYALIGLTEVRVMYDFVLASFFLLSLPFSAMVGFSSVFRQKGERVLQSSSSASCFGMAIVALITITTGIDFDDPYASHGLAVGLFVGLVLALIVVGMLSAAFPFLHLLDSLCVLTFDSIILSLGLDGFVPFVFLICGFALLVFDAFLLVRYIIRRRSGRPI